jgi:glycosyltransferase involved in cell wall biosynthesis
MPDFTRNKYLFLTLKVFQATGGIEKVCRVVGKALYESVVQYGSRIELLSMYDRSQDANHNAYFPSEIFRGYNQNKILFVFSSLWKSRKSDTIILSHINLLLIGYLIKKIRPQKKLVLFAHGIEIWDSLPWYRKKMLKHCDHILAVSAFTKEKVIRCNQVDEDKCLVLNNCLDPYLPNGNEFQKKGALRKKLGINEGDFILFTLTRISAKERYKGYDQVIRSLSVLRGNYPNIRYVIGGSYDQEERAYIMRIAEEEGVKDLLHLTGFIPDEDLVAYFKMADVYVMPSMKEGFGIVFIEAMYYGLPVIAGNKDGSVDALLKGELGVLVNPTDKNSIETAIQHLLSKKQSGFEQRELLMDHFSYEVYKRKLGELLYESSI